MARITIASLQARIVELEAEVASLHIAQRPSRPAAQPEAPKPAPQAPRTPEVPFRERCAKARELAMKSHACVRVSA